MDIEYEINLHTDWHCGSGLAAGADVDSLVIKDRDGLPFIPGKTVKGLLKEATEDILFFRNGKAEEWDIFQKAFGFFDGKDFRACGEMFFANAELPEEERRSILARRYESFLYRSISSTRIDDDGIAVEHSLRKMQVTVPCKLEGTIMNVPEILKEDLANAMKYVKRLGQNRNRGLGRCTMKMLG